MVNKIIMAGLWVVTGFMSISGASRSAASSDWQSAVIAQMELNKQHQLEFEQLKKYLAGRNPVEVHPLKAIAFGDINWGWVRNSWDAYDKGALLRAAIIVRSTFWITRALNSGADINAPFDRYFPDESDKNYQEPAIRTDGFNPLQYAVVLGYADVVRLLLTRGADVTLPYSRRGKADKTVRQLAQEHGHTEIVGILDPEAEKQCVVQ